MDNKDMPAMLYHIEDTQEDKEMFSDGGRYIECKGLTKLEYIAAMAMQALLSKDWNVGADYLAGEAIEHANALLKQLEESE